MSSEESVVKGGHLPAVKVGGMRITQNKNNSGKSEAVARSHSDDEEFVSKPESPPKQTVLISGTPAVVSLDFPTAAVKATHEKPQPLHDYRPTHSKHNVIHQPRK